MGFFKKNSPPGLSAQPVYVKKDRAAEYEPLEEGDLSYRELRLAQWYVNNKSKLRTALVASLMFWIFFSVGYSGYRWIEYYLVGYPADTAMLAEQVDTVPNYDTLHRLFGAAQLRLSRPRVFDGEDGKYDFMAEVENPNLRWLAAVSYNFSYAGGETKENTTVLLPGAKVPLMVLGQETNVYPAQAALKVRNVEWRKISAHEVPEMKKFLAERLMFEASPIRFTRMDEGGLPASRLQFTVFNLSAYSFWQPTFAVLLLSGGEPEGAVSLILDQFRAGEERDVDLRFLNPALEVSDIMLVPMTDLFDQSVYMKPGE